MGDGLKRAVAATKATREPWRVPKVMSGVDMAFPATVSHLMPPYGEIPEEFKRMNGKWVDFFRDCFYTGVEDVQLIPMEGVDPKAAWTTLVCIRGSFEPKHEHKMAAFAYLCSLWFKDGTWKKAEKKP
jgi:hypothetical protein